MFGDEPFGFGAVRESSMGMSGTGNGGSRGRDRLARGGITPRRARISDTTAIPN